MEAMELIRRFRKGNFHKRDWTFPEILQELYSVAGSGEHQEKEPGFPPDASQIVVRVRTAIVAGLAGQIMAASAIKTRTLTGEPNTSFLTPKECAEMAAEIWLESSEAVRNMDGL